MGLPIQIFSFGLKSLNGKISNQHIYDRLTIGRYCVANVYFGWILYDIKQNFCLVNVYGFNKNEKNKNCRYQATTYFQVTHWPIDVAYL